MPDSVLKITVVKRDGTSQFYNPDKIIQVAEAAGLEIDKSVQLAQIINEWISGLGRKQVTSIEIRDKVQEALQTLNPQVADLYHWYQRSKGQ